MKKLLSVALVLSASMTWAQTSTTPTSNEPAKPEIEASSVNNSNMDAVTFYQIFLAELASSAGKLKEALLLYLQLAQNTPTDQLFERAVRIPLDQLDGDTARTIAVEWVSKLPESSLGYYYLFEINYRQQQYDNAATPMKRYLELIPLEQRVAAVQRLSQLILATAASPVSVDTTAKVLQSFIENPNTTLATKSAIRLLLARMQVSVNRNNAALEQMQLLTLENPTQADGWLFKGGLELESNALGNAEQSFLQFLSLAQPADLAKYQDGRIQSYLALAQITESKKDFGAAKNWLDKIDNAKDRFDAQLRRASIMAKQGELNEAINYIDKLAEQTLQQSRSKLFTKIRLLRDYGQAAKAIVLVESALSNEQENTELMYELAITHEKLADYYMMELWLRKLIAIQPNSATALNALGYSLADRSLRLEEAKALIDRALAISPNSAYIQDSLAWVLFRMGDLNGALAKLEKAYLLQADAEIGAHLGEVLWQLNRKEEAKKVLLEAQMLNAENSTLVKTIKRLGAPL